MSTHMETWSRRLWQEIEPTFAAILSHPFITGLTDGSLDTDAFAHYLAQDVHYLRDYARALAVVGAKAPTLADTAMFARHAADVLDVELGLHGTLLPALGLPASAIDAEVMPTTRAYTSYLLATAYGGGFAEGLAAILPCYWIYERVGAALIERGSPDARFQSWIDSYGGEEFAAAVAQVLALTDEVGRTLNPAEEAVARAHFAATARYEWMFFDAAHRRERWPV
ncbi:thiaminase II [Mycolicibacterium sp. P1-18]|uniref:thiaminase II n=1 Tax=Mycolicibacterium sp. P1-18 TaxID=2024615 RepID=UPI0011F21459|nr:thiaminase II [Mycolicibacterium sp. P1-18]KAA0095934.1 thiaminase II [Mycolicibacterium sp. P1-18]